MFVFFDSRLTRAGRHEPQASDEFRCAACDALRHVVARRANVAQGVDEQDDQDIIKGLTLAANAMSTAAERVISHPNQADLVSDPEEVMFIKRLGETMASMAGVPSQHDHGREHA